MRPYKQFTEQQEVCSTPQDFFDEIDKEFHFTLNPCALPENAKCEKFYTPDIDGLKQSWEGETVFCNPPYGKKIVDWVRKCWEESQKPDTTIVLLIPARTDTRYFHEYIYHKAELRFIKGRLKFNGMKGSAPFPSMLCIYKPKNNNNE